ncbi:MAG TPA: hypothetical protein PLI66_08950, partial [Spirochaetales bacterium]|nr:hypothetical protein [Spirochaetales bacterium]
MARGRLSGGLERRLPGILIAEVVPGIETCATAIGVDEEFSDTLVSPGDDTLKPGKERRVVGDL